MRLRNPEIILLVYFLFVALLSHLLPNRKHLGLDPLWGLCFAAATILILFWADQTFHLKWVGFFRDWWPLALMLLGFRELDWFTPTTHALIRERAWLITDQRILNEWGVTKLLSHFGGILPMYLEACYFLVYSIGPASIAIFYLAHKRSRIDKWLSIYLCGTLLAYSLIPFFPSMPPRYLPMPEALSPFPSLVRRLNLWVLDRGTIHSGVFPSAHVSSVFSAAWGMFLTLPRRPSLGWAFLIYAVSVSIATVYGRYHYAVDAAAGLGVSVLALVGVGALLPRIRQSRKAAYRTSIAHRAQN